MRSRNTSRRTITAAWLLLLAAMLLPVAAQQKKSAMPQAAADSQPGNATKGREVYSRNCAICHYPASTQKKVGPGLKEIYKRGEFADGKKVDDASMRAWIEKGGRQMPPFKAMLSKQELSDIIAYLKTL